MHDSPVERRRVTRALSTALAVTLTTSICAFGAMSPASAVEDSHPFGLSVVADQPDGSYVLTALWHDPETYPANSSSSYDVQVSYYDADIDDTVTINDTVEDTRDPRSSSFRAPTRRTATTSP